MRYRGREEERRPRLLFTPQAKARLDTYVKLCEGEVSGLGRVSLLETGDFLVDAVALLEQESDHAGTVIAPEAVAGFYESLLDREDDVTKWRLWFHSHGLGETYWSGIDEEMCASFHSDWFVSVVANRAGEALARIDIYTPVHVTAELPIGIYVALEEGELERLRAEVAEKVTAPRWDPHGSEWWKDENEKGSDQRYGEGSCGRSLVEVPEGDETKEKMPSEKGSEGGETWRRDATRDHQGSSHRKRFRNSRSR